jgi:hypothetical protein
MARRQFNVRRSDSDPSGLPWDEILSLIEEKCRGITLRELPISAVLPRFKRQTATRARIAVDPPEIDALLAPKRVETCPVCGEVVQPHERVAASLQVDFAKGPLLQSVWAHQLCLDRCTDTEEQRGSPA